jgi:hypothetical protein
MSNDARTRGQGAQPEFSAVFLFVGSDGQEFGVSLATLLQCLCTAEESSGRARFNEAFRGFDMADVGDVFKPGEKVPVSGIYLVQHDPSHTQPHEVTCVYGKVFPPCGSCKSPRFKLVHAAKHIANHDLFK